LQTCGFISDGLGDPQQLGRRSRKPIETGDDKDVVRPHLPQQLLQSGPLTGGTGDLLLKQPATPYLVQPGALQIEALILG
jgi:hypothetical protein